VAVGAGAAALLVGGGYGTVPLVGLAHALAAAGHPVQAVVGAATANRLHGVDELAAAGAQVHVTTDDGSAGRHGTVTDALVELLVGVDGVPHVYACGPMAMLAAVERVTRAAAPDADVQCAVEEAMACGIGVCMTCVLPVVGADGHTRMLRSCREGPVFDGSRVRWDAVGTVPDGCVGTPEGEGRVDG
jgi:dihydroorotate dehydrogenase electron transfer subunit